MRSHRLAPRLRRRSTDFGLSGASELGADQLGQKRFARVVQPAQEEHERKTGVTKPLVQI
jgi:hypothetical protein